MPIACQPKLRFLELCTDVVREILFHCEPPELVSLSRVSRDLRYFILKDPYHERLWRDSMRNFARDIPPCPDHIRDEVLYANLLFGANRCSACGSSTNVVNWEIPSMICKKCLGDPNSTARKRLTPYTTQDEQHRLFGTIVPKIKAPPSSGTLCLYNPAMDNLRREYMVFQSEWKDIVTFQQWFESMEQVWKQKAREAALIDRWHNAFKREQQRAKKAASALINEARYKAIIHRIEKCSSWKDEMVYVNKRDLLPVIRVRKPQLLTDGDWKKMEPKLKRFFDERQKASIVVEDERLGILAETIFAYIPRLAEGPSNIYPPFSNIFESQPFRGMIFGTHYSKGIPRVDWEKAVSQNLIRITQEWITKQTTILKNFTASAGRVADLDLAVNLFRCSRCTPEQLLTYRHVLTHECCHGVFWTSHSTLPKDGELRHLPSFNLCYITPITGWDEKRVRSIIRICGLDPDHATAEDIHRVDFWLDCQFCRTSSSSWLETDRTYMCWDSAIQHKHAEQWLDPCRQWMRVPDESRRWLWTNSDSAEIQLPKVICQRCGQVLYHDFTIIEEHSRQHHQQSHSVNYYGSMLLY